MDGVNPGNKISVFVEGCSSATPANISMMLILVNNGGSITEFLELVFIFYALFHEIKEICFRFPSFQYIATVEPV